MIRGTEWCCQGYCSRTSIVVVVLKRTRSGKLFADLAYITSHIIPQIRVWQVVGHRDCRSDIFNAGLLLSNR